MNREAYEAVIGLEVHTHLLTRSKLFCGCSTTFGAGPNENVCQVCMGMPGVLPVLNRRVVELAIRTGLAAHCTIAPYSIFDRKSYFYPDLPKGYQISQYETPICKGGYIDLPPTENGDTRRIGLTRIHIEDAAGNEAGPMRSKEYANDYRCFPEPDLARLVDPAEMVETVRASMPELPADRNARYVREGLTEYEAGVLLADRDVADYFEAMLPGLKNRKAAANWVMTEVLRVARDSNKPFVEAVPPAPEVGALLTMVEAQKISLNAAKTAFAAMVKSSKGAEATIAELGLAQVS